MKSDNRRERTAMELAAITNQQDHTTTARTTGVAAASYRIDSEGRIYGNFYWVAPADLNIARYSGPPVTVYDRHSMGDKQAWKAAKAEAKELSGGWSLPRLKVYGSDFVQGALIIVRANDEKVIVSELLSAAGLVDPDGSGMTQGNQIETDPLVEQAEERGLNLRPSPDEAGKYDLHDPETGAVLQSGLTPEFVENFLLQK
jgi:hypothetical protein